jgi:phosphatidylserine/phosphatidylglycerophosphate/cardiolipin synthase-like enzyme
MASNPTVATWVAYPLKGNKIDPADQAAIDAQANKIAQMFADFVGATKESLHIAIYDFRLDDPQAAIVMGALNTLAEANRDVKVAYFDQPKRKNIRQSGGDMTPGTDGATLRDQLHKKVQVRGIQGIENLPKGVKEQKVEGGGHLMHSKYMIRDGAVVWMGSANFTTAAWSVQDNNVVQVESEALAKCYETDFQELWQNGRIAGTGKNDLGEDSVSGYEIDVAFSPGEGSTVEKEIAAAIMGAKDSVAIASMVISSGAILGALVDAMGRGVTVTGVYDGPEMGMVVKAWAKGTKSAGKVEQWNKVSAKLVAKWSAPYSDNGPHNFMHNKLVSVDGKVLVTGSFNFSENATKNAENILTLHDPAIAAQYEKYVGQLVAAYKGQKAPPDKAAAAKGGKAGGKPRAKGGRTARG